MDDFIQILKLWAAFNSVVKTARSNVNGRDNLNGAKFSANYSKNPLNNVPQVDCEKGVHCSYTRDPYLK